MKTVKNWWALNQPLRELKGKNMAIPGMNDKEGYFHGHKTDL
jgi:hypothetical protein